MSVKRDLLKAIQLIAELKITDRELMRVVTNWSDPIQIQVLPPAMIRVFHALKVKRTAIEVTHTEKYVHVHFIARGCDFGTCMRFEEAEEFLSLEAKQKRIAGVQQRRLAASDQRRLAFAGDAE